MLKHAIGGKTRCLPVRLKTEFSEAVNMLRAFLIVATSEKGMYMFLSISRQGEAETPIDLLDCRNRIVDHVRILNIDEVIGYGLIPFLGLHHLKRYLVQHLRFVNARSTTDGFRL
jgi:hypothetical protein